MPTSPASTGPALAQDLDSLARPLPGKVIEHQLTSESFHHLLAAYVPVRWACQGTRRPRRARAKGWLVMLRAAVTFAALTES